MLGTIVRIHLLDPDEKYLMTGDTVTPDLTLFQGVIMAITARIAPLMIKHRVLDGHWGNYPAAYTVRECGYIISKLRRDAMRYLP